MAGSASAKATVYISADYGATWQATTADPFGAGEAIAAIVVVQVAGHTRIIAARGTADMAHPAEIAYSDDGGATWTAVNVGTVNGQYAIGPHSLFAFDANNIYLAMSDGYVYASDDAGESWAVLEDGSLFATDFNVVKCRTTSDVWVAGEDNSLLHSATAGASWDVVAGPATKASDNIISLWPVTENRIFIGYDDGELWYTEDQGEDGWAQRGFTGDGVGAVQSIEFVNELVGYVVHDTAAPVGRVLRTIDGGYSWDVVQVPANAGLNGILVLDANHAYIAGNAVTGVGVVMEIAELGA